MLRTIYKWKLTRPLRRRKVKLVRTKFPIKNCFITMLDVPNRYFVNSWQYKSSIFYITKERAYKLHKKLKATYYWKFRVHIQVKKTIRILIQE